MTDRESEDLAARLLAALDEGRQVEPPSEAGEGFTLDDAYRIQGRILARRVARGESVVGWKIGFTNRQIWDEYGVRAPIWGPVFQHTLIAAGSAGEPAETSVGHLPEPKIEPEIVFRLAYKPKAGMNETDLPSCIDGMAHGFEVVQSIFRGWRFRPADTVAAFALHGMLCRGPVMPLPQDAGETRRMLEAFSITLLRNGRELEAGVGANVLGGPLSALKHFVDGFDAAPFGRGLEPGDLVTTGTVTRAYPVQAGETWSTRIEGLPLAGIGLRVS